MSETTSTSERLVPLTVLALELWPKTADDLAAQLRDEVQTDHIGRRAVSETVARSLLTERDEQAKAQDETRRRTAQQLAETPNPMDDVRARVRAIQAVARRRRLAEAGVIWEDQR